MRSLGLGLVTLAVLMAFPQISEARKEVHIGTSLSEKFFSGYWGDKIWEGRDFQPYLGDETVKNRILWDQDKWTPQDWAKNEREAMVVLRHFYQAGILSRQYHDDNIPVLEVGEPFMRLSHTDRGRVLQFVDYIYKVTSQPDGMYFVRIKDVEKGLGTFNKAGFQQY